MDLTEGIIKFLKRDKREDSAPEGLCPNCWGRQEYSGQFYEAINNESIDLNNIDEKRGWIQAIVAKNITGIALQEENGEMVCQRCKTSYKIAK